MALGNCLTMSLNGVLAQLVDVEANVGHGLPGIHVVGQTDTAISESRDRIKTAAFNSHLPWPKTKVVVSMSPASLPKSGSHFDLPIALAILAAQAEGDFPRFGNSPSPARRLQRTLVLGELGLDGSVRPVAGIIPALLAAREQGISTLIVPPGNAAEATLVPDLDVLVAASLKEAFSWACGNRGLPQAASFSGSLEAAPAATMRLDFCDIAGQANAKWAAEVAAAGGHHLMMIGPPGAGKSMIASRLPTILPTLTPDQQVETTAIHSLTGTPGEVIEHAPFIAPHASVTRAALLGGGSGHPRPGAVSLAHNGVLFLDEVSEVAAPVLDGLRAPLEEGQVRLARSRREVIYPARFQLVMAANPCRCSAEDPSQCRCNPHERMNYLSNLSGPLRDRLDMVVTLSGQAATINAEGEEDSAVIAERVAAARERAAARWWADGISARTNGEVPSSYLRRKRPAADAAMVMLSAYLAEGEISQRGVDRVLRLSWTLADLAGKMQPDLDEVGRALDLRGSINVGRLAA
ncbi:YifB family Mg chelatase-like AAA ATPase [Corynebacterium kefirresidentii]|uniref:YifB family Mg chelatase-like AAA ATPase n=1 Tax=Corynebacterium TaxID=1716 RepID=UPI00254B9E6C|nr:MULTISPECIES: YifB family Mg chelatase-like AAA ATPase [Corynebacterium]MDK8585194.1 YifB family Mg chelatase-like AAA ATPase [Corynebacterium kefirresidentii]MDU7565587.1 YifB family Mg chelatase-like AAA ATPase [Corynebacterium sp.]